MDNRHGPKDIVSGRRLGGAASSVRSNACAGQIVAKQGSAMVELEKSSPKDIERKIKDCLRWSKIRTDRRPHLPSNDLSVANLLTLLTGQRFRCALTNVMLTQS